MLKLGVPPWQDVRLNIGWLARRVGQEAVRQRHTSPTERCRPAPRLWMPGCVPFSCSTARGPEPDSA